MSVDAHASSDTELTLHVPTDGSFGSRRHVLKDDATFAVFDSAGDIAGGAGSADGLYRADTRIVSRFVLEIDANRPLLLSATANEDGEAFRVDLTNADHFDVRGQLEFARESIAIQRLKFVWSGRQYERVLLRNFDSVARELEVTIRFDADFADLFEVRGERRARRGTTVVERNRATAIRYRYSGLDGEIRTTTFAFDPEPLDLDVGHATMRVHLEPGESARLFTCAGVLDDAPWCARDFFTALRSARRAMRDRSAGAARVETPDPRFAAVLERSTSDLAMLVTEFTSGPYPCAGIPWFATPFGRDGIITALFTLWYDSRIARGVLAYLAQTQATETDERRDAQPGKILHETRDGEMARLGEVPFGRYYGSVDATPLFLLLLGAYFDRTHDRAFVESLWPNAEAALAWIDHYGDRDGDGFVEYERATDRGLANQGWKDSKDAIFHEDGTLAKGAIALCEVQSYTFGAKQAMASLARALGRVGAAARLDVEAERLRQRFEDAFWCEDLGTYALALDGEKRPCRVRASNAGHALLSGIASPERARRVAATLLSTASFSGWGIRTVDAGAKRYNPMSYHNGSIWPHDNALIALGFARYGLGDELERVFEALASAAFNVELSRLPELFCGFARRSRTLPTLYPVACSPQAWAAVAPLAMLGASLGLRFDVAADEIRFERPALPEFLDAVTLRGLSVGPHTVDVLIERHGGEVALTVLARSGRTRVVISHEAPPAERRSRVNKPR
jgi:glycogen debranching enzyme